MLSMATVTEGLVEGICLVHICNLTTTYLNLFLQAQLLAFQLWLPPLTCEHTLESLWLPRFDTFITVVNSTLPLIALCNI